MYWYLCDTNIPDGRKKPLWMEKWMCAINEPQGQQTQLRCQELCEEMVTPTANDTCVGISYNLKTYKCFLCTDYIMTTEEHDYGEFFEMPERKSYNLISNSYEWIGSLKIILVSTTKSSHKTPFSCSLWMGWMGTGRLLCYVRTWNKNKYKEKAQGRSL